uniref:Uncharacterized protein n=1 Tax=Romanomermis culicivorax TaxID=13658 RepID=A0A915K483_ROMCU
LKKKDQNDLGKIEKKFLDPFPHLRKTSAEKKTMSFFKALLAKRQKVSSESTCKNEDTSSDDEDDIKSESTIVYSIDNLSEVSKSD